MKRILNKKTLIPFAILLTHCGVAKTHDTPFQPSGPDGSGSASGSGSGSGSNIPSNCAAPDPTQFNLHYYCTATPPPQNFELDFTKVTKEIQRVLVNDATGTNLYNDAPLLFIDQTANFGTICDGKHQNINYFVQYICSNNIKSDIIPFSVNVQNNKSSTTISDFKLCDNQRNHLCSNVISSPSSDIQVTMPAESIGSLIASFTTNPGTNVVIPLIPTPLNPILIPYDYTLPQKYEVTAADGVAKAKYTITVSPPPYQFCSTPDPAQFDLTYNCAADSSQNDFRIDFSNMSQNIRNIILQDEKNNTLYNGPQMLVIDKAQTQGKVCTKDPNQINYNVQYDCGSIGLSKNIKFIIKPHT